MPSLERRITTTRRAVEERRDRRSIDDLARAVEDLAPIRPFTESIGGEEISFVLRLPSYDAELLGLAERGEAAGLAISLQEVTAVSDSTRLPLVLTDVVVDPYQLYECRACGGDGAILIAAAFEDENDELISLHDLAVELGLDVILEVAGEEEIERTLELLDPDSFLIRNRGADGEGEVDFERTFSLLEEVPAGKIVLSQGGVRAREEVVALERAGVDAAILGPWIVEAGLLSTLEILRGDAREPTDRS
jgi:hypothetical protein